MSTVDSRRGFIAVGFASIAMLGLRRGALATVPNHCALTPEAEEGPFYIPAAPLRADLASGQAGVPLGVTFRVLDAATCDPIALAIVDIWHCDAMGVYSGYDALAGPPGPPPGAPPDVFDGPPHAKVANTARFLRGIAATGTDGSARFSTIFPGYYEGRVNHIHLKVRLAEDRKLVHTGQLFFPEDLARELSSRPPYAAHRIRRTTLAEDHVFTDESGSSTIANVRTISRDGTNGYAALLTLVVDRSKTPEPV